MKHVLTALLVALSSISFAQDYNFLPKWKKGEEKNIKTEQVEKEYEDGVLISDSTYYNEGKIAVIESNKENYVLELTYENQALRSAELLYAKMGEEMTNYKDLKLRYSVNKQTAETELMNWEEARDFMNGSLDQITSILEEKVPDMSSYGSLMFAPIKKSFSSKENIEAYMESEISFLFIPFNKNFEMNTPQTTTDTGENPFNPSQELTTTTTLTLTGVDSKAKTCTIEQSIEFDLSEFIEMLKGMMKMMAESFGAADSTSNKISKEMDEFEMDIDNTQVLSFDMKSTWVTQVVNTGIVTSTDPKRGVKSKKEVIITITVE